ncbi:MAG: hypothetical protein KGY81_07130, partial [Phycisphaerae bacterium]|nr:hypothetical protein [Phycisphaerae bacterium]
MTSTAASGHDVQPSREARTPRWAYVVALLLVAFGMAARVRHYALDMSFWWDEAMLADNLVRRDAGEMLEPLDNRQAAPAGFLLLTKTVGSTFGYDARTLRSVPFAASLAGLLLFGPLAWRVLGWRWALPALALLAVNMHQIGHAAELKQYSGDSALAIGLLVIAAGIHRHGWHPRLAVGLAGLGAAAVWFSHPAVFVLAAIGSALFLVTRHELPPGKRREHLRWLALISVAWCVSFGLHFWFFVRPVAANSDLRTWWHFAFWPIVPRSGQHLMWYRDIPIRMFRYPGGISMLGLGALTFLAGCVGFFRRDRAMLV